MQKLQLKSALILTTYKRLDLLPSTISRLNEQTNQDFFLCIIHNDSKTSNEFLNIVKQYNNQNKMKIIIAKNAYMSFERHIEAAKLAKDGYEIIIMLDDDIAINNNHVQLCVDHFEKQAYKSSHAYAFKEKPLVYLDKIKHDKSVYPNSLHYCGPGVSVIDASLFLMDGFFDREIVSKYYMFDDIWLSAFAIKNGWRLDYLDSGAIIGATDSVAMFGTVAKPSKKQEFLDLLVSKGFYNKLFMLK